MMAENPSFWWSLSGKPPLASQQPSTAFLPVPSSIQMPLPLPSSNFFPPNYIFGTSPVVLPPSSLLHHDHYNQDHFPLSWSHLLMGGLASEEERGGTSSSTDGQFKKLENWEDQILNNPSKSRVPPTIPAAVKAKQELDQSRQLMIYNNITNHHGGDHDDELQACSSSLSTQAVNIPIPSSAACSSTSTSVLDFSTNYKRENGRNQSSHHSSECNGTNTSGAPAKKARVQPSSSTQPPLKVRKEKLGDRITALHQIVSPFGKTDTASVLLEAIEFIRFLEGQIEALTSPYLGNASSSSSSSATTMMQHYYPSVKAELHTEEPDHQLLNDDYQKGRGTAHAKQDEANDHNTTTDLSSRGLCLVPVSCTDHIDLGGNNGSSEYWAPALGGGGRGF